KYAVHVSQAAEPPPKIAATGIEVVDRKITFTTGEASITLDGPDIVIEAKGKITVKSRGDDVVIKGGPNVKINCKPPEEEKKPTAGGKKAQSAASCLKDASASGAAIIKQGAS